MTLARANSLGWAAYELLTAAQMNLIDTNVVKALDGYAGGIYTPSATLELDGAGIASGSTMKLRAPGAGAGSALELVPDTTHYGLYAAGATSVSLSTTPAASALLLGLNNIYGPGAPGLVVYGGQGGSGGAGGYAIAGQGGAASASGQAGGVGFYGIGGTPKDTRAGVLRSLIFDYSGAGHRGQGADATTATRRGGPGGYFVGGAGASGGHGGVGVFGKAGAGSTIRFGVGGLFHGYGATGYVGSSYAEAAVDGDGLVAIGGCVGAGGVGVVGFGGSGTAGGVGGYFEGRGSAWGLHVVPGPDASTAAYVEGGISFPATLALNPTVTAAHSNTLFGKNLIKAWGIVRDGVLIDGFNVASAVQNAGNSWILDVTLATAMFTTNYAVMCTSGYGFASNPHICSPSNPTYTTGDFEARTTTFFQIAQQDVAGSGVTWATSECYFMVLGRQ